MNDYYLYNEALLSCFTCYSSMPYRRDINSYLQNYNGYYCLGSVDISKEVIEIPLFAKACVERVLFTELERSSPVECPTEEVIIRMEEDTYSDVRRGCKTILKDMASMTNNNRRLKRIDTNKGLSYYLSIGAIFDSSFSPLLMCSITTNKVDNMLFKYQYSSPTVYIHPKVFLSANMVEKWIIKEVIPFYLTHEVHHIGSPSNVENLVRDEKPTILIQDASEKFLRFPNKPSISSCTDEAFNQVLIKNIPNIIS